MESSIELKNANQHYVTPIEQVGLGSDDALSDILSTESHDKADMERLGKRQELRVCKVWSYSNYTLMVMEEELYHSDQPRIRCVSHGNMGSCAKVGFFVSVYVRFLTYISAPQLVESSTVGLAA